MNKFLMAVVVGGLAVSTQASYLFWQVDSGATIDQYALDNPDFAAGGAYARLRTFETKGGSVDFQNNGIVEGVNGIYAPVDTTVAGDVSNAIQVELLAENSYYIELLAWDSANQTYAGVGKSEVMTYEQLASAGYTYSNADLTDIPKLDLKIWNGGVYTVPEPTGALMMVLGLAFLGLKRRTA